jgi:crotonobetainyl-CoA:carnitine CoA-transferase CaiB-like acyl-CoA transferase
MNDTNACQTLRGVTVLDFSTRLPGPLATLMLAQAGARVIKIERPPQGDEVRAFAPRLDGQSAHFAWLNRGKESLALDLKRPADRDTVLALVQDADVLVEQFRPGVMERLGLGYAALADRNPRLIYCSITGYGQNDARSMQAAHDLNYQASAGLLGLAAPQANGLPALPHVLLGDIAGGTYPAVMSILMALLDRARTGRGQYLDIGMGRNVEVFALWSLIDGAVGGKWPRPGAARHTGGSPRYNLYAAADGKLLAVAALEKHFWRNFLAAIALEVSAEWERDAPAEVIAAVAGRLAQRDAADWLMRFAGKDVCCNLAPELAQAYAQNSAMDGVAATGGLPFIRLPIAPQFTSGAANPAAPALGQHHAAALGISSKRG